MQKEEISKYANLLLAVLFPLAWFAPLIRTGLSDWLGLTDVSVASGLQALWETDIFLAIAVTFFALVAPLLKCLGLALIDFGLLSKTVKPAIAILGKLAMADIFILAMYVVVAKGIGIGEIEVAWGLYLFTGCVILSLFLSVMGGKSSNVG
jgi:paraquat-inducible protein A